jgi:hypothetical protein
MIERLGPSCAIGTDGVQWIVYAKRTGGGISWDGETWGSDSSTATGALLICIEAKGLKLSAAGRAAIDRQDAKIYRWRRVAKVRAAAE